MPTTNPVPSTDPTDLLFNAGKLDEVVNGTANSFTDRLGVSRRTVAGMNADFDAQLADAESDLNVYRADAAASAAEALGYLQTIRATSYGAYAEDPTTDPLGNPPTVGDEYFNTTSNLLKRWNGTTWQASDINTANLAASSGSSLVGYDGGTVQDVLDGAKSLQDYAKLRSYTGRATRIYITGLLVTAKPAGIAGTFQYDPTDTTSVDNGVTTIVTADNRRFKRDFTGSINVLWSGAKGDGSNQYTQIASTLAICLTEGKDLYFPEGVYSSGNENMPFRNYDFPATSLLDFKNITVFGDGPNTILCTNSINGADVLQLNSVKNIHFKNLKITSTISGSVAGSNGISVTGGFDNITLDHIWCENLPSLDKTTYVDGGKALSMQTPVAGQMLPCGSIKATNIFANGCVYGFGYELDLVAASTMTASIDVDIIAENCREAVIISAGAATAAIPAKWSMGLRVRAKAINCMQDVILGRVHGVDIECQVITTKTKAQRILNYAGVKWFSADTEDSVLALAATYAKNSKVAITGDKGDCAYIAQIGAIAAGSSGLSAATEYCEFNLGVFGSPLYAAIDKVAFGGFTARYSTFICSGTGTPATDFYLPANNNAFIIGNLHTLKDLALQGALKFTYTNGADSYAAIDYDNESVTVQQTLGATPSLRPLKVLSNTGGTVFAVRNDAGLIIPSNTAASVSTVKGAVPIYNASNVLVGYLPIYTSYA